MERKSERTHGAPDPTRDAGPLLGRQLPGRNQSIGVAVPIGTGIVVTEHGGGLARLLAQAQRDQLTVVVQLYRALGGGWSLSDEAWTGSGDAVTPPRAPTDASTAVIPVDAGASDAAYKTPTRNIGFGTNPPNPAKAAP